MDAPVQGLRLDCPAVYCIRVQGLVAEAWADWLGGMAITTLRRPSGQPITSLNGSVADQAALHGLLATLYGLGLPLISVRVLGLADCAEGEEWR